MLHLRKLAIAAALLSLTACVAGTDASHQAAQGGSVSVFVLGLWHGLIGPITLIGEIINTLSPHTLPWTVHFYETQGSGVLYDVGFFVGLVAGPSILFSGVSRRARV
jgi:hypothetical protein